MKSGGVENRGRRREELLRQTLRGHGVSLNGSELQADATRENIGQRLHNLIQAMLSFDDMFVLSQSSVQGVFIDDVARFLDLAEIRYVSRAEFSGKSGLDHLVDFVVPKSREKPERVLQILNTPRRDRVENMLFAVSDTRAVRGKEAAYYALVNDSQREVSSNIINAFSEYDVKAYSWSHRDELAQALAG